MVPGLHAKSMTTIERYRFLEDFYGNQRLQLERELDTARDEFKKWRNLRIKAEIAEQVAKETGK